MIEIVVGNVGSGKTANSVKELFLNMDGRVTFSNIKTKGIKNNISLTSDMIIKQVPILNAKGEETGKFEKVLNVEYWEEMRLKYPQGLNFIIDEAHTLFNARRSMSKMNVIMTDFLALIRKIVTSSTGKGKAVFITQLPRRIDSIAREMCTLVKFYRCHYYKVCLKCGTQHYETNDTTEKVYWCQKCLSPKMEEQQHVFECFHFKNILAYELFTEIGRKAYHRRYFIQDTSKYFGLYDTLQLSDLISTH